jgi:hypothetical protein
LDSFLEIVGVALLGLSSIAIATTRIMRFGRWIDRRVQSHGSDEEFFHSDGDPMTRGDHLRAPDPRSLPVGRAYGDNHRVSKDLPWFYNALILAVMGLGAAAIIVDGFLEAAEHTSSDPWDTVRTVSMFVIVGAGVLVWRLIFSSDQEGSRRRRSGYSTAGMVNVRPAQRSQRPRARRKRKYRRQL